jgi:adenosylcobinamide-GDP ribazoletransferase
VTAERDAASLVSATVVAAVVTMITLRTNGLILWALTALVMVALGRAARRRVGGVTGDVFGASVELTETAVLFGAVLLTGRA